jgi:signal transduction histidine kinase
MIFHINALTLRGALHFFVAFLNLAMAIMLWRKSAKNKAVFYLSLSALFSSLFAFTYGATYLFWDNNYISNIYIFRSTAFGVLIVPNLVIFAYYFTEKIKHIRFHILFWYLAGLILFIQTFFTDFTIKSVYLNYPHIIGITGSLDILARLYVFIGPLVCFIYLLKEYFKTVDTQKKIQIKYFIWGLSIYTLGGAIVAGIIPIFSGESTYTDFVADLSGVWVFFTTYAILKHQLLDIHIIIKKALIISLIISLISGVMMAVSLLSEWFAQNITGFRSWTIPVIASFTAFFVGNVFWRKSKEVEKLKSEFVTVAAHKLRTPLAKIKWALEMLPREIKEITPTGKQLIAQTKNANQEIIELAEELLNLTKTQSNIFLYNFELINLEELVKEIIAKTQDQIKSKDINLTLNAEKNLPKVRADKIRLSSAIQVLIDNAIMYSPPSKGKIIINIKRDKNNIVFSIKDHGIGIKQEDILRIFSSFYRTKQAYSIETEGLGIGLFIAQSIINRHHGYIGAKSKGHGKGSTFWFSLPVAD